MSCKSSLFPLIKEISVCFFMASCCFFSFQLFFQEIIRNFVLHFSQ